MFTYLRHAAALNPLAPPLTCQPPAPPHLRPPVLSQGPLALPPSLSCSRFPVPAPRPIQPPALFTMPGSGRQGVTHTGTHTRAHTHTHTHARTRRHTHAHTHTHTAMQGRPADPGPDGRALHEVRPRAHESAGEVRTDRGAGRRTGRARSSRALRGTERPPPSLVQARVPRAAAVGDFVPRRLARKGGKGEAGEGILAGSAAKHFVEKS